MKNEIISEAQQRARAKRCKTYTDKVRAVRATWKENDRFFLPKPSSGNGSNPARGTFLRVVINDKIITFPYSVLYVDDKDGKQHQVGLSRFHDDAQRIE